MMLFPLLALLSEFPKAKRDTAKADHPDNDGNDNGYIVHFSVPFIPANAIPKSRQENAGTIIVILSWNKATAKPATARLKKKFANLSRRSFMPFICQNIRRPSNG